MKSYRQEIELKAAHCLVVGIVESVLEWNRSLHSAPDVSQSYGSSQVVSVSHATENLDSPGGQTLQKNRF